MATNIAATDVNLFMDYHELKSMKDPQASMGMPSAAIWTYLDDVLWNGYPD